MGEVYLAKNGLTEQLVALKVVSPEVMRQPGIRERFVEEARVMSLLRHPGIVQLYSFFEEGNRFFMAMEYIEGRELDDCLEERPLDVDEAVSICGQMLEALAYAHSLASPIVHRDIKPGNILVTKKGRVVIIDFGVAKALGRDKMTKTGAAVGTYEYMSPEQVQGEEVSPASDIYAAGIVLYKMLSGIVPFPQQSQGGFECMKAQVEKEPPAIEEFREGIPDWLVAVLGKALSKDAAQRYQNAGEMAAAIREEKAPEVAAPAGSAPVSGTTAPGVATSTTVPGVAMPSVTETGAAAGKKLWPLYGVGAVLILLLVAFLGVKLGGSGGGKKEDDRAEKAESANPAKRAGLAQYDRDRAGEKREADKAPSVGYRDYAEEKDRRAPVAVEYAKAEEKPAAPEPICRPACSGRDCGDDGCGGSCGSCRSGWTCKYGSCRAPEPVCQRSCGGKDCGGDGCGGSCGSCDSGWTCEYGRCKAPEPVCRRDCSGKDCGEDGCGGSCGSCRSGWTCSYGSCKAPAMERLSVYEASATDWNYRYEQPARYAPAKLLDSNSHTAWCKTDGTGESITLRLSSTKTVRQVRLLNGYQKIKNDRYGDRYYRNSRVSKVRIQDDSGNGSYAYLPDEKSWQYIEVDNLRTDRIVIRPTEGKWGPDRSLCISEVEIWGND